MGIIRTSIMRDDEWVHIEVSYDREGLDTVIINDVIDMEGRRIALTDDENEQLQADVIAHEDDWCDDWNDGDDW